MSSTSSNNNDNSISQTDRVLQLLQENPLSDALEYYAYGTAGFRYKADWMEGLFVRVGIVSAFLLNNNDDDTNNNSHVDGGNMGLMVTASHNDESYNGIKVSNPDGSMMTPDQERLMVEWVNQKDLQPWKIRLESYFDDKRKNKNAKEVVLHVGRDTRSHSQSLTDLAIRGAKAMGITVTDHGILTTPMLHHIVLYSNLSKDGDDEAVATRASYIQHYAQAYCDLIHSMRKKQKDQPALRSSSSSLRVDCACGVGFKAVQEVVQAIQSRDGGGAFGSRMIHPWNAPGQGPLNVQCGSEHVQKQLQSPNWYSSNTSTLDNDDDTSYCCALDGDADRIVFFAKSNENDDLLLLDGDKIAVLIAHVLQPLVRTLDANLTMGVVQTAYANGASTKYLKSELNIPVVIAKTGVKHVHHAALQFDIGIYFEANGHGTVLFSDAFHRAVEPASLDSSSSNSNDTTKSLLSSLARLINPAVGDAISDLLLVHAILQDWLFWSLNDWNTQLYHDLPSRQFKLAVADRSVVRCNENETRCLSPVELQPLLDQAMGSVTQGRCFVRASGTENVVRIYAEAATRQEADRLASMAYRLVHEHCGGTGPVSAKM